MPGRPVRYLTSNEIAEVCGVSARTVSNWMRDGAIPSHRTVGGHGRVSEDDLRQFLTQRGIPVPPELGGPSTPVEPASSATRPAGTGEQPAPRRRLLVIDDDEALLEVMKEALGVSGYDVEVARHGFLAGYLVGHHRPDAILLDIMMPGLDGYEVLSLLRRRPEARVIPVLACTSLRGAETEARIRGAGFAGYVRKPIDFRSLLETLAALVGAGGPPASPASA